MRGVTDETKKVERIRWDVKLAHPGWALLADQCPNCKFPEAEGGYCPNCGWTRPHPFGGKMK